MDGPVGVATVSYGWSCWHGNCQLWMVLLAWQLSVMDGPVGVATVSYAGLYAGSNYCQFLVDTWMLTVKPVYKLSNVRGDLKSTTNAHVTPFTFTFKA